MKKTLILYCLLVTYIGSLHAQKKIIDTSIFRKWPAIQSAKISNDGKYFLYTLHNVPLYSQSCIIQQVNGSWKKELPEIPTATFSDDSRKVLFNRGNDTIVLLTLQNGSEQYIHPANGFELFMQGKNQWIACQLNNPHKELLIKSLNTDKEVRIKGVESYQLSKTGNTLVYTTSDTGNAANHLIHWASFNKGIINELTILWKGSGESGLILDKQEAQLAFLVSSGTPLLNTIWLYKKGDKQAKQIVDDTIANTPSDIYIESPSHFSIDGKRLFFYLKEKPYAKPSEDAVMVDVWSYHDAKLQSNQYIEDVDQTAGFYHKGPRQFLAVQDLNTFKTTRLQHENEEIRLLSNNFSDEWARVIYRKGDESEQSWNIASQPKYYLVSTITGTRKNLPLKFDYISPTGKYFIGDVGDSCVYTYEVSTGKIFKITDDLPGKKITESDYAFGYHQNKVVNSEGIWFQNDDRIIIKNGYDLWAVDPTGEQPAINLTKGYGIENKIRFSFINHHQNPKLGDEILLDAFSDENQSDGFYKITVGEKTAPVQLSAGPYIFLAAPYMHLNGSSPIKARDAHVYLVTRISPNDPGNLFWTKDFKTFNPLTDLHPEKEYNWYTSELLSYRSTDNRMKLGILYKPENFDPNVKYPLIVNIYEKKSERLNKYIYPDYSDGDINIPFFVSNGYLVFTPDIDYKLGAIGESALQSIVGGATHLSKMSFVNSKKIGICGHSFGGFETLFTITHSDLFAAAVADAGVSNFISQYGRFRLSSGISLQSFNENEQNRMGANLWTKPEAYIANSPIFYADQVTAPLLMVNNKMDAIVHFEQGLQMFLGLRRLGKKAWLLQYDNEPHTVSQKKNRKDMTIRMTQFFDHYLKDSPCPNWMLNGIPAKLKGIKTGYELDMEKTPGTGLLTKQEEIKMKQLEQGKK